MNHKIWIFLPADIKYNILINYLNIHENILINKYIELNRNNKIIKAKNTIDNKLLYYIYRHIKEFNIIMNDCHYHIPKNIYKKYYPLCYRKNHMEIYIKKFNNNISENIINIYNNINIKGIYYSFNEYIDLLTDNELFIIGW
jgi:hypothetical protein